MATITSADGQRVSDGLYGLAEHIISSSDFIPVPMATVPSRMPACQPHKLLLGLTEFLEVLLLTVQLDDH